MSDEFYKFLSIAVTALGGIITTVFAFLSLLASQKNSRKIDIAVEKIDITKETVDGTGKKLDELHGSVNGLLAEKTIADTEIGKKQGVQQEKAEQKDRDDSKLG